jgi:NADPH-dependent 7-cyano-7-deazaguanine reductase QueF-like protein
MKTIKKRKHEIQSRGAGTARNSNIVEAKPAPLWLQMFGAQLFKLVEKFVTFEKKDVKQSAKKNIDLNLSYRLYGRHN